MEVSFSELKEKEIINVFDGKKLGRIIDILFDNSSGTVRGVVVPGEKKLFRKGEDIFVPLEKLKKIGDDVILVSLQVGNMQNYMTQNMYYGNNYIEPYRNERKNQIRLHFSGNKVSVERSVLRYHQRGHLPP